MWLKKKKQKLAKKGFQQVNSQSQSGAATFGAGLPFFASSHERTSSHDPSSPDGTTATAEALKKELHNTVTADDKSNAQGQGQITQAGLWEAGVFQIPVAVDLGSQPQPVGEEQQEPEG